MLDATYYEKHSFQIHCTLAAARAPAVLAWSPQRKDWLVYDPSAENPPANIEPELFFYKPGCPPYPLSATGAEAWWSLTFKLIDEAIDKAVADANEGF